MHDDRFEGEPVRVLHLNAFLLKKKEEKKQFQYDAVLAHRHHSTLSSDSPPFH